ncbi:hypothetical protein C8R45DRAFT_1217482 [Mycena sanguinolenta]|nr:hypothetical protein C8R45DRAFT_1217482 [Mycena sanguinolenta]
MGQGPAFASVFKEHNVDVVISTVAMEALDVQKVLVEAAHLAAVKLFVLSEFGISTHGQTGIAFVHKNQVMDTTSTSAKKQNSDGASPASEDTPALIEVKATRPSTKPPPNAQLKEQSPTEESSPPPPASVALSQQHVHARRQVFMSTLQNQSTPMLGELRLQFSSSSLSAHRDDSTSTRGFGAEPPSFLDPGQHFRVGVA